MANLISLRETMAGSRVLDTSSSAPFSSDTEKCVLLMSQPSKENPLLEKQLELPPYQRLDCLPALFEALYRTDRLGALFALYQLYVTQKISDPTELGRVIVAIRDQKFSIAPSALGEQSQEYEQFLQKLNNDKSRAKIFIALSDTLVGLKNSLFANLLNTVLGCIETQGPRAKDEDEVRRLFTVQNTVFPPEWQKSALFLPVKKYDLDEKEYFSKLRKMHTESTKNYNYLEQWHELMKSLEKGWIGKVLIGLAERKYFLSCCLNYQLNRPMVNMFTGLNRSQEHAILEVMSSPESNIFRRDPKTLVAVLIGTTLKEKYSFFDSIATQDFLIQLNLVSIDLWAERGDKFTLEHFQTFLQDFFFFLHKNIEVATLNEVLQEVDLVEFVRVLFFIADKEATYLNGPEFPFGSISQYLKPLMQYPKLVSLVARYRNKLLPTVNKRTDRWDFLPEFLEALDKNKVPQTALISWLSLEAPLNLEATPHLAKFVQETRRSVRRNPALAKSEEGLPVLSAEKMDTLAELYQAFPAQTLRTLGGRLNKQKIEAPDYIEKREFLLAKALEESVVHRCIFPTNGQEIECERGRTFMTGDSFSYASLLVDELMRQGADSPIEHAPDFCYHPYATDLIWRTYFAAGWIDPLHNLYHVNRDAAYTVHYNLGTENLVKTDVASVARLVEGSGYAYRPRHAHYTSAQSFDLYHACTGYGNTTRSEVKDGDFITASGFLRSVKAVTALAAGARSGHRLHTGQYRQRDVVIAQVDAQLAGVYKQTKQRFVEGAIQLPAFSSARKNGMKGIELLQEVVPVEIVNPFFRTILQVLPDLPTHFDEKKIHRKLVRQAVSVGGVSYPNFVAFNRVLIDTATQEVDRIVDNYEQSLIFLLERYMTACVSGEYENVQTTYAADVVKTLPDGAFSLVKKMLSIDERTVQINSEETKKCLTEIARQFAPIADLKWGRPLLSELVNSVPQSPQ
jgi:hypothetical protein